MITRSNNPIIETSLAILDIYIWLVFVGTALVS